MRSKRSNFFFFFFLGGGRRMTFLPPLPLASYATAVYTVSSSLISCQNVLSILSGRTQNQWKLLNRTETYRLAGADPGFLKSGGPS